MGIVEWGEGQEKRKVVASGKLRVANDESDYQWPVKTGKSAEWPEKSGGDLPSAIRRLPLIDWPLATDHWPLFKAEALT